MHVFCFDNKDISNKLNDMGKLHESQGALSLYMADKTTGVVEIHSISLPAICMSMVPNVSAGPLVLGTCLHPLVPLFQASCQLWIGSLCSNDVR